MYLKVHILKKCSKFIKLLSTYIQIWPETFEQKLLCCVSQIESDL